ncbi:hypothetical protein HPP92_028992, partial [Vanilla planifolia]
LPSTAILSSFTAVVGLELGQIPGYLLGASAVVGSASKVSRQVFIRLPRFGFQESFIE